jgi:hypothetical protein
MKMNVTFVTAFLLPRNGAPTRSIERYRTEFQYLADAGVPLYVYLDERCDWDIPGAERICIQTDWLPGNPKLPDYRNHEKDTVDYMCIQAMKLDLVARAASKCSTPYLAWIDFGVFHMMSDKVGAQEALRQIAARHYPRDKLIAPGCWPSGDYTMESVCWRFCGSFVLGHRDLWAPAYQRQMEVLRSIAPKITWEVNVWSRMDDLFYIYSADHNEALFCIPKYKMSLVDLVDNSTTDKNTQHAYLDTYEKLLSPLRDSARQILEIGIGGHAGGLRLFRAYFPNATIHGADITSPKPEWGPVLTDERIILHAGTDAYTMDFIREMSSIKFDVIVDDGPHTLESMKVVVTEYSKLLKEGGILIIEDVQDIGWIEELRQVTPEHLKSCVQVYDLRPIKNRYDDILFVINTR